MTEDKWDEIASGIVNKRLTKHIAEKQGCYQNLCDDFALSLRQAVEPLEKDVTRLATETQEWAKRCTALEAENKQLKKDLAETSESFISDTDTIVRLEAELKEAIEKAQTCGRALRITSAEPGDRSQEAAHYNWLDDKNEALEAQLKTLQEENAKLKKLTQHKQVEIAFIDDLEARLLRYEEALKKIAGSEAVTLPRMIDKERDKELLARMDIAKQALEGGDDA